MTAQDWNGPVHWGSRVINVGSITTIHESPAGVEHLEPLPVDHATCSDESVGNQHMESPTSPDLRQGEYRKTFPHADQDTLLGSDRSQASCK